MKISALTALVLVSLMACNAKVSTPSLETIRVQIPSEPTHLDPYLAETGAEMTILRNLVRTPLRFVDENGWKTVGDAAESYAWSADGRKLNITFRADLRWSDGAPLTACQYREGILRMLGKGSGQPSPLSELYQNLLGYDQALRGNFAELEGQLSCRDAVLVLATSKPHDRSLLNALAFLGSAPWREGLAPGHAISSGAFRVVEWKRGRSIKIAAVEPARLISPHVEYLFIRDADTALIMYEKGDLEVLTEVPVALLPKLRSRPDLRRATMMATYYVAFSLRKKDWAHDVGLRRALALSAGREEIPSLLQGGERAAYTLTPDDMLPSQELSSFRSKFREDPKEARRLWDAAKEKAGVPVPKRISLGYPAGSRHQLLMERLANNWRRHLGVEVSFEPQEWNHYVDLLKKNPPSVFRYAWTAVYPDPRFFLNLFDSSSLNNFGRWRSTTFDARLHELEKAPVQDSDFWQGVLSAEEELVWKEAAVIPLYHYSKSFMARGEVGRRLRFTYQGFVDVASLTRDE